MTDPRAMAARAAALLGGGVLLVLAGMYLGHEIATTQAQAEREQAAAQALRDYRAAVAEGNAAVAAVHEQLRLQKSYYATLDERQRHAAPLTVPVPRCSSGAGADAANGPAGLVARAVPAGTGDGAAPPAAGAAGAGAPGAVDGVAAAGHGRTGHEPAGDSGGRSGPPADGVAQEAGGLSVSLAAVSLWNSALAGHDVPAGACRADATAQPACAASAGIGLHEVWANHRTNAAACAADRARHRALIDHISRRDRP